MGSYCPSFSIINYRLMTDSAICIAALWASIHNLRILVNRGLAEPEEVEELAGAVLEGLQTGCANEAAIWEAELAPLFAEMKAAASKVRTS